VSAPEAPDQAVRVHSVQEEYFYMMVHPCACGGPWLAESKEVEGSGPRLAHRVDGECYKCKARRTFNFILDAPAGPKGPIRQINPTAEPSAALDVAEWMDLAQFYLARIERLKKPLERAQSLLDARQCLEEAMKFYGPGDDAPPPAAIWSDAGRTKVARQPAVYRRSALEAMLAKIPPMDRLREADKMEQREFQKALKVLARERVKWWQVWKFFKRR
jgi:hypothetical protein